APQEVLKKQLQQMGPALQGALPSNVPLEKFRNVVLTAANQNADLLAADRRSLLGACIKCASDGLIPDGREAALVIFNTKIKRDGKEEWVKAVQYMPMMVGVLKRARNSGQIAGISVQVVHKNDEFVQRPDDFDKPLTHRPPPLGEDRGEPIGAYAMAKLTDGTIMAEVMSKAEIEAVRKVSRSKDFGPWKDWWDQMARKTVLRRLSKYLPMDAVPQNLMERDDMLGAPRGDADAADGLVIEGQTDTQSDRLDAIEGGLGGDDDFPGDRPLEGEVIPPGGAK
uniref:recombinase RecT n=1 Tax=Roseomonas chloroacetimidivorans TaxID=1766656 RepID=UPI003C770B2F